MNQFVMLLVCSVAVLAEISLRSPGILFIYFIKKLFRRFKVSQKNQKKFEKKTLLVWCTIFLNSCVERSNMTEEAQRRVGIKDRSYRVSTTGESNTHIESVQTCMYKCNITSESHCSSKASPLATIGAYQCFLFSQNIS